MSRAALILLLSATWTAATAQADNKVAAEALFDEGRQLMDKHEYAAACEKFAASQRLDPGVGTMLNLADCYERLGKTASAWAQFREARAAARAAGNPKREQLARQRADALEGRLSRLTIVPWAGQVVEVTRDGQPVQRAEMGIAIPVDPGRHEIAASAPGKRAWSAVVTVGPNGAHERVAIPILPDEPSLDPAQAASREAAAPLESAPQPEHTGLGGQRVAALVAGGAGLAGVAVGTIFGLQASAQWDDALSNCESGTLCNERGVALGDDASTSAAIATIGFTVGGVGLAAAAILWFTAGDDSEPQIALSPQALWMRGRF